jgi:heme oxygenase (biliverdin-producing, ferredoxin)
MSILREHTNAKHRAVEENPFVQLMLTGKISKEQHILFLKQFYVVYREIEYFAETLGLLHDLPGIKRKDGIAADLAELGHNIPSLEEILPSTQRYREHIMKLYYSGKGNQILAHVYVRHMGDLYGGKILAKKIPGQGKCYQFEDRPALIKALDAKLTMSILDEALLAFDMSESIFNDMLEKLPE